MSVGACHAHAFLIVLRTEPPAPAANVIELSEKPATSNEQRSESDDRRTSFFRFKSYISTAKSSFITNQIHYFAAFAVACTSSASIVRLTSLPATP